MQSFYLDAFRSDSTGTSSIVLATPHPSVIYAHKMTSDSDKRKTRIAMDPLKHLQSLPSIPEPKELFTKAQTAFREDSRSPDHLPKGSKRRRTASPEGAIIKTRAGFQDLILPKPADAGIRPYEHLEMKYESPWQSLQKVYELTVKNFVGSDSDEKVKRLQQIQQQNLVEFLDAFYSEGSVYVVLDYVPISLTQMVSSPAYPTELQLAAILGQVNHSTIK